MKKYQYYFTLLKIYFSYITGKKVVNYFPVKLWIETSGICNLACRLCVNKDLPDKQKNNMNFDLFRKIIDEIKTQVYEVNLFHRGEALINPEITEMIDYAVSSGIKTRLHTNAVLLDSEMSEKLIKSGLHRISFSFDGYTKEMYEKNRIGAEFEDVLMKINEFLRIKKDLFSKTPHTTIQVIEYDKDLTQKELGKQKRKFFSAFKNNTPDRFVIRKPHNWGGSLKIAEPESADTGFKKTKILKCTFLWYAMVILSDGKVVPCPQDFFGRLELGDINRKNLKEIFNDNKIVHMRKKFSGRDIDDLHPCSNCDRVFRRTILGIPSDYMGIFFRDSIRKN